MVSMTDEGRHFKVYSSCRNFLYYKSMAFNHYAKIKRILESYTNWRVVRINEPTSAKNFKGETRHFDHYYRVIDEAGAPIKYCKFQQLDRFAQALGLSVDDFFVEEI